MAGKNKTIQGLNKPGEFGANPAFRPFQNSGFKVEEYIMSIRTFAFVAGLLYLGAGILGFVPGITVSPPAGAPSLMVESSYGYLLGLFPVNLLHNLVHIGIGGWGLLAYTYNRGVTARSFAVSLAVIYGLLAILGIFPQAQTFFGFVPIFGHDVWLHAVTAIIAGYFGFLAPPEVTIVRRMNTQTNNVKVYEERPGH